VRAPSPRDESGGYEVLACESRRVCAEKAMHLAHRLLCNASVVGRSDVLENGSLGLARFLLLDLLVHEIVHVAPIGSAAVVFPQGLAARLRDLHSLGLDEGGGAQRCAPRNLVREPPKEVDDRVHLRDRGDSFPRVPRKPHVVADPLIELHVIGGSAYLAAEIPEVLDKQVSGAILTHLQLVAARVDAAEHARKPADEKIPLGNVPPRLLASQRAAGKPLEVLRFAEGVLSEQLGLYGIEPVGRHGDSPKGQAAFSERRLKAAARRAMRERIDGGT